MKRLVIAIAAIIFVTQTFSVSWAAQLMTRTIKSKPAIVLTAFGTSTRAKATYTVLEEAVRKAYPDYELRWAFTSEIIRQRVNARIAKSGEGEKLLSLQQALADLEAEGYTKAVVQPLHVFPGEEYGEVMETVKNFPGITIYTGETMLHRWESVHHVLDTIAADFLPVDKGCNVLVAHGTPTTNTASNIAYLGLDRLVGKRYSNAFVGAVDGILTREDALGPAKKCEPRLVRFIPFMYVAGNHIMRDIMDEKVIDGEMSWSKELNEAGVKTEITEFELEGKSYYKGLGFYPEVYGIFIGEIGRALERF